MEHNEYALCTACQNSEHEDNLHWILESAFCDGCWYGVRKEMGRD